MPLSPKLQEAVDTLVRDMTTVVPCPKSEAHRRITDIIALANQEAEEHAYNSPCNGCSEGHPSFWKTIVESGAWSKWEKEVAWRLSKGELEGAFDVDESRECGWFSPEHFREFLKFISQEGREELRKELLDGFPMCYCNDSEYTPSELADCLKGVLDKVYRQIEQSLTKPE